MNLEPSDSTVSPWKMIFNETKIISVMSHDIRSGPWALTLSCRCSIALSGQPCVCQQIPTLQELMKARIIVGAGVWSPGQN